MGAEPLHFLNDRRSGIGREDTNEQVNVVLQDRKGHDFPAFFLALCADQAVALFRHVAHQQRFSALRAEEDVVDKKVNAMLVSLVFHVDSIPQNILYINTFEIQKGSLPPTRL
jgi:hypothetical protein